MSTFAIQVSSSTNKRKLAVAIWLAVLAIGVYFVLDNVPRYLTWSEESYGSYYWPRAGFLLPHVLGGLIAIIVGPFQFWPQIRNNHPKIHRMSGRIYLISIAIGALGGLAMALTSTRGIAYGSGLFFLAIAWLLTSGMALIAIRNRKFVQHKQWMIRSYVVTFAFVTFRIVADTLLYYGVGEPLDVYAALTWACWAVPLLITELIIQAKPVFASGKSQS